MKFEVTLNWDEADCITRSNWCRYVPLPERVIEDCWGDMTSIQKQACFRSQELSSKALIRLWHRSTRAEQSVIGLFPKPAPVALMILWDMIDDDMKLYTCKHKSLPVECLDKRWDEITSRGLMAKCLDAAQTLPMWFIEKRWKVFPDEVRIKILEEYTLPPKFIIAHWFEFTEAAKLVIIFHRLDIIEQTKTEELVPLLVDDFHPARIAVGVVLDKRKEVV